MGMKEIGGGQKDEDGLFESVYAPLWAVIITEERLRSSHARSNKGLRAKNQPQTLVEYIINLSPLELVGDFDLL